MSKSKTRVKKKPKKSAADEKRQQEAENKRLAAVAEMFANPETFYRVQQNFETLINLVAMVDNVMQELKGDAPFLFVKEAKCYKDLQKSLDDCLENLRTDPILYGRNNDGDAAFMDAIRTADKLLNMLRGILLRCTTEQGVLETQNVISLQVATPNLEKYEKYKMVHETLRRHQWEFPYEVLERWRKFEEVNKVEA